MNPMSVAPFWLPSERVAWKRFCSFVHELPRGENAHFSIQHHDSHGNLQIRYPLSTFQNLNHHYESLSLISPIHPLAHLCCECDTELVLSRSWGILTFWNSWRWPLWRKGRPKVSFKPELGSALQLRK
jgi:hypothetical protein